MQASVFQGGPWTQFHDMHSGGGTKQPPYELIYIEAPEAEAKVIFYNRFGHNPERVTCTCCGEDYSTMEAPTLARASGYERGCANLETPREPETGRFKQPDDPWFKAHYYLEPDEHAEAEERGWTIREPFALSRLNGYRTVEQYVQEADVLVIPASGIKPEERAGEAPVEGYVWMNGEYGVYSRETGKLLRKGLIRDGQLKPAATVTADEGAYVLLEGEQHPRPVGSPLPIGQPTFPITITSLTTVP